ncbi:MAG: GspMb/PilO family protein [Pseudohongiellaceae bacterium]
MAPMQLDRREKTILALAGITALALLVARGLPVVGDWYDERAASVENVQLEIERERRLIDETVAWRDRRIEVEERETEMTARIFQGPTIPIIGANIEGTVRRLAQQSGLTISSTRLLEPEMNDDWLMVTLEMSFRTADSTNPVSFLRELEVSAPRLYVSEFSLNRNRNQFSGSVTVAGFARTAGIVAPAVTQR